MKRLKLLLIFVILFVLNACGPSPSDFNLANLQDYYLLEDFDLIDIQIQVKYDDGTEEILPLDETNLTSEDLSKLSKAGDHQVSISIGDLTKEYGVRLVSEDTVKDFYIPQSLLNQQHIIQGFEWSDLEIVITKYDGNTEKSLLTSDSVVNNTIIREGANTIEVIYQGVLRTFDLEFVNAEYNVRFIDYDGSVVLNRLVKHGSILKDFPQTERTGYTFNGWNYDNSMITEDTDINADYTVNKYTIDFIVNGVLIDSQEVIYGGSAQEPFIPEVQGFVFKEWSDSFSNVTSSLRIEAIFEEKTYTASELYELVIDSIVEITVFDNNNSTISLGTGFVIEDGNTVITNYHVIEGGSSAQVLTSNGLSLRVREVLGYDKDLDIAILSVSNLNLEPLKLSNRPIVTGEKVIAIGSSLGYTGSVSEGIVSSSSRLIDGVDFVQMTAPISPGNSGGPLFNQYGEVIAINTLGVTAGNDIYLSVKISDRLRVVRSNPMTMSEILSYEDPYFNVPDPYDIVFDELEPNNYEYLATRLVNGVTMEGIIGVNDIDWFVFTPSTDGYFNAIMLMEYRIDVPQTWFWIEDSQGNYLEIAEISPSGEGLNIFEVELRANNIYYIGVLLKDTYAYSVGADYTFYIFFG